MLFVFTTNLANNKEKTTERSSLFLFFEKKLQKRQISPRYIFEKILEKYKGVRRDTLFH